MGASTLQVSVVVVDEDVHEVNHVHGTEKYCGEKFTQVLVDFCIREWESNNRNAPSVKTNKHAVHKLRIACEKAKKKLSSSERAEVVVEDLVDGVPFNTYVSRETYEELAEPLVQLSAKFVSWAISNSPSLQHAKLDYAVFGGGAMAMPKLAVQHAHDHSHSPLHTHT